MPFWTEKLDSGYFFPPILTIFPTPLSVPRDQNWLKAKIGISGQILISIGLQLQVKHLKKQCFFIYFIIVLKGLVILAKIVPIANVNRPVFANQHSVFQFLLTRQPIAERHLFFHHTYKICKFFSTCSKNPPQ